jgi:uncharacterized protein (TIGR02147 family)
MKSHVSREHMAELPQRSFREFLQAELAERCARNPQYSLRAFALDLGTDHSTLSQLLRGRRKTTDASIERFGRALGLDNASVAAYIARERLTTDRHETTLIEVERLTDYAARVVTDWEHFAILELTRLDAFTPDVRWIGRVLGLPPDGVTLAVNRLIYLGMLEMRDAATWIDTGGDTIAGIADFTRATVTRLFDKVGGLVRGMGPSNAASPQDHSATTIAVDQGRIAEAIERIHAFRREIIALLDAGPARDAVYRLDVHLYPVTQPSTEGA